MNRRELVAAVAEKAGADRKEVDAVLAAFVEVVTSTVAAGDPVSIPGFAKFVRVDRPAHTARNPATGETIQVAASRKVRITPLKAFKDAVLG